MKTASFECSVNVVVCKSWIHRCNLSSIIRSCIVWLINDRKFCSVHTESALGQLIPVQMDGRIQTGRRFLGVARGFDQELKLSSDLSFSQAKEKLLMSRRLGKQRLYFFLLFWYGSSLSLFPVSISLPCVRPAKQINACGSLFVVFCYANISVWNDLSSG